MVTGKQIKEAIRVSQLTMQQAADKMGVSRQTLYGIVNRGELDEDVSNDVITKLGLVLQDVKTNDKEPGSAQSIVGSQVSDRYIKLLEDTVEKQKEEIVALKSEVKALHKVREHLDDLLKNQKTILSQLEAGQEVILSKLSSDDEDYQSLMDGVGNTFLLKRRELERMGNRFVVGSSDT
jgi:hypothetical protein